MKRYHSKAAMKFTSEEFRLRDISTRAIVRHVSAYPGQTRADLAERLALPKSTVISLVHRLLHDGWLMERDGVAAGQRGRRSSLLHLRADRLVLLGVELGVRGIRAVATTLTGDVLAMAGCTHGDARDATGALDAIVRLLREVHDRVSTPERHVVGLGIGLPGLVDEASGCLTGAPALSWGQLPVARLMRERLRGLPLETVPLYVQSHQEVAAAGEREFARLQPVDVAVGAAAFARHRLVQPFKAPARLPALVARYGHRYNAPAVAVEPPQQRDTVAEAVC